ncbi:MAG TPA: hypothetical protein VJV79_20735 [Polyangiaceae bacterium]|nr:hypothetical protein [Polyangiaceae bacterium]
MRDTVRGLWWLGFAYGLTLLFGGGCARSAVDTPDCACIVGVCDSLGRCVECFSSAECDDALECTTDACVEGRCRHSGDDSRCAVGRCDLQFGCRECRTDAECADEVGCTQESCVAGRCASIVNKAACGLGFCDPQRGCLQCLDDRDCDDHVACSSDRCQQGTCAHTPLDSSCDGGFCDLVLGCLECRGDADCTDGVGCTSDTCVVHRCYFEPDRARCPADLQCDAARGCVGCLRDSDCADGVWCTKDACVAGVCSNAADDSACSSTQHCDTELDCILCRSDEQCQDGLFCTGHETCVEHQSCAPGQPLLCDDGVNCTVDVCSELNKRCLAAPDASLCPAGEQCLPSLGCSTGRSFFANTADALYSIDLSVTPPTATRIGGLTTVLTDIAQTLDGRLFGVSSGALFLVDPATAQLSEVGEFTSAFGANGLTEAPDGTLYASVGSNLYRVDPSSAATDLVGSFGPDISSSGDLVWGPLGAVFLSDYEQGSDRLVSLNPLTAAGTPIGSTGISSVYGLSFSGLFLFGLSEGGELLQLDPMTGKATVLHDFDIPWWGAS